MTYITERKKVRKELDIRYFLDGKTVAQAHEFLASLLVDNRHDIIDIGTKEDYGLTSAYICLVTQEWETEKDYEERKRLEARQQKWERQSYERLKKKFEG